MGGLMGIQQTAAELGLLWDESIHDWGIVNADPFRLDEFSTYYQNHSENFDWAQQLSMGELLFESANDALLGNVSTEITPEEVIDLILKSIETKGA